MATRRLRSLQGDLWSFAYLVVSFEWLRELDQRLVNGCHASDRGTTGEYTNPVILIWVGRSNFGFEAGVTLIAIENAVKLHSCNKKKPEKTHDGPGDNETLGVALCGNYAK